MGNSAKGQNQTTKKTYRFPKQWIHHWEKQKKTHIQQIQSSRGDLLNGNIL